MISQINKLIAALFYSQTEDTKPAEPVSFLKLLASNRSELPFLIIGCLGSFAYGSCPFLYGLVMGGVFDVS